MTVMAHDGIDHTTLLTVMISLFALSITSPFMVMVIQYWADKRKNK